MTEAEKKLHEQIAEMEGDMTAVIDTFGRVLEAFKIDLNDFTGEKASLMAKMPSMLNKVTSGLVGGAFETVQGDFQAIMPIIKKYEHLYKDGE